MNSLFKANSKLEMDSQQTNFVIRSHSSVALTVLNTIIY